MNVKCIHIAIVVTLAASGCLKSNSSGSAPAADSVVTATSKADESATQTASTDPKKQALLEAYPEMIASIEDNVLTFTDGTTMIYDDGREKDFVTALDESDPEDMFFVAYDSSTTPEYLHDPGRSRSEELFKKLYGNSADQVKSQLVTVDWIGEKVKFTGRNGAADSLQKVAEELRLYPDLAGWLKSSGTFYWRSVRGAKRLSAHSYGIAFDIGVDRSDYWLWKNPGASETAKITYHNRIPKQIVEIFEKHGFIWGGAWYHYDTMHFEYRPEILRYAQLTKQSQ
ncbi:MAG: M15 family metallopeptidase [Barnesiella sp.]|nr:M15 family metallopeptidase [Barnesiella sp.]